MEKDLLYINKSEMKNILANIKFPENVDLTYEFKRDECYSLAKVIIHLNDNITKIKKSFWGLIMGHTKLDYNYIDWERIDSPQIIRREVKQYLQDIS